MVVRGMGIGVGVGVHSGQGAPSGIGALSPAMTINGQTVLPTLRLKGGDANTTDWPPWAYGETLPKTTGTEPTFNAGSPLSGPYDDSVDLNFGAGYRASNNALADFTNQDIVVEIVAKQAPNAGQCFMDKRNGPGILIDNQAIDRFRVFLTDGTNTANIQTAGLTEFDWYHLMLFIDRSGSAQWFVNGVASGSAVSVSLVTTLSVASPLTVGHYSESSASAWSEMISYLAIWAQASWLDTHSQGVLALGRYNALDPDGVF